MIWQRWLTPRLQAAAGRYPIIVLTGARQVGKTTLVRHIDPFRDWDYLTLDNLPTLSTARGRPTDLWANSDCLVLDEVQRAPDLLDDVGRAVTADPRRRFLLIGSADVQQMRRLTERLNGRVITYVLGPLTEGESRGAAAPRLLEDLLAGSWESAFLNGLPQDPLPLLRRGLMPAVVGTSSAEHWQQWWEQFVTHFLERDLRHLAGIDALPEMLRLMVALAQRTGRVLNQSEMARETGLSQPTAHRYIRILETSHLLRRLPAYVASPHPQLTKSPRFFWCDPALGVHLAGHRDSGDLENGHRAGGVSALVVHHVQALADLLDPPAELAYWRIRYGTDVELVVVQDGRILAVDVVVTDTPTQDHGANLRRFLDYHPEAVGGLLLHEGEMATVLFERVVSAPWHVVMGASR